MCFFYRKGKCAIYDSRPIDCRLYPFDIRKNADGENILVWYSAACPKEINADPYKTEVLSLISELGSYVEDFANNSSPLLDKQKYVVVGVVSEMLRDE